MEKPKESFFVRYAKELAAIKVNPELNDLPDPPFVKEKMKIAEEILKRAGLPKEIVQGNPELAKFHALLLKS